MPSHLHKVTSESATPTEISPSMSKRTSPQAPSSCPDPLRAPPSSTPADSCPPGLSCPVSSCPLILKGETPHRYLRRHLNYPGLHGRTGQEKEVWINLHKREHERLLATLVEESNTEEERNSRTAEFELRARRMGIIGEKFIAQKVAIWEGMWAAQQNGDDIGYDAWILPDATTSTDL